MAEIDVRRAEPGDYAAIREIYDQPEAVRGTLQIPLPSEALLPAGRGGFAVVLSSIFFTLHHVIALRAQLDVLPTILASLGVFVGGIAWSWCYLRYRSVWPGYLSHLIVDVTLLWIGWQMIFVG